MGLWVYESWVFGYSSGFRGRNAVFKRVIPNLPKFSREAAAWESPARKCRVETDET